MNPQLARRASSWLPIALLGAVCYLPLLLTHPGKVGADTKSYLYLDPGRLLERAWSMWDPNVGLGTVTHQNIGYLWPMGPWYWLFERLGTPDWVAQRLWLGSILFLAGLGVRFLLKTLGQDKFATNTAMFIYALSPYVLTLAARISALLLPFVGLPWMLALIIKATRSRNWLHPALFALLIPTVGSTNATALILAGLAPVLWLPFAVFVLGELTIRQALAVVARIGVLTIGTSLWWMAGLYCQSRYGLDVLQYSETAKTVADPATAPELLRGLGYWFFYGDDKLGPWIESSVPYTQNMFLMTATFGLATIGLLAAGFVRWRYRSYFVSLTAVGLVVAVGAHPWDDPTIWGEGVKAFLQSQAGLAMRSLPRAVPLIALGMSVMVGAGLSAIAAWSARVARPLSIGVVVLAIGCLPPLWTGNMVARNLERPEAVPAYWRQAAEYLEDRGTGQQGWQSRVLEIPGSDFASYRWGNTVDPILPGLMDRPYAARELIPYGTPLSADLLNSLDRQLQEGVLDPAAIAPIARFMSVGDINLRADLAYERFNLPRPRQLWQLLRSTPGLEGPVGFGDNAPNVPDPSLPLNDELELASPPDLENPPKVAAFGVTNVPPIMRLAAADSPVLLAGSGEGLVDSAGAGLLKGDEFVLYSGSLADDPAQLVAESAKPGASLILTDTNRKAATRWGTVHENSGYTEEVGEAPLRDDLGDNRLPLFPDADQSSFTVLQQFGGVHAQATAYGNPVTYTPENRAAKAIDEDPRTAWIVGSFSGVEGQRIELTYDQARETDRVILTQADLGVQNRWITKVRIRFDNDENPLEAELGVESRKSPGQVVEFGTPRKFKKLSIEIVSDDVGYRDRYDDLSAVGFGDIRLGNEDLRSDEVVRLPNDLLGHIGSASANNPLAIVLTRLRSRPSAALRTDQEQTLARAFALPTSRQFSLEGQARLSHRAPGTTIDKLLGVTAADGTALIATESRRLPGDMMARSVSAIDGDPSTHFSPGFLKQVDEYVDYQLAAPISFDHMDLRLVTDGRHSVPTRIRIEADDKVVAGIDLPNLPDLAQKDATTLVPVKFDKITGSHLRVVIEAVREVRTNDWISKDPATMPVGISELGIPGLSAVVPQGRFDSGCRSDLLTVDDNAVPVRATGTVSAALAGGPLDIGACASSANSDPALLSISSGTHTLRSTLGAQRGIDLDRLTLRADGSQPKSAKGSGPSLPTLTVLSNERDSAELSIAPHSSPVWLLLGQSHSLGWKAKVNGRTLPPPTPVNGYANAWLVAPSSEISTVNLDWSPQRIVWGALIGSGIVVSGCIALVLLGLRRKRGKVEDFALAGHQPATFEPTVLWRSAGSRPSLSTALAVVVVTGLAGVVVLGLVAGVAVAASAFATLRWRRSRSLTTIGPALALAASGLFVMASQVRHNLEPGFGWPQYFEVVHPLAYAGVALLALDVVVDRLWTGRWWPRNPAGEATGAET